MKSVLQSSRPKLRINEVQSYIYVIEQDRFWRMHMEGQGRGRHSELIHDAVHSYEKCEMISYRA